MLEREWREASDMRRSTLPLLGVLATAALLRFWSLGAGIPTAIGIDEPQIMNRAVHMMKSGSLNPNGFYDYPGLYLYVQMGVACVRFLAGAMSGEFRSLNDARPEDFYLWGRAVTAALGTLTVLVVFRIGLRWGTRYALLASALLAVAPLHVRESHYVLTDVPATFFVTLTFLLSLAAHEKPSAIAFAKAGAAAGLAAATKYPGALAMILPLVGVWMTADVRPSRVAAALSAIAAGVLAFLLAAPYTILDLPGFLNGYAGLAAGYAGGTLTGTRVAHLSQTPATEPALAGDASDRGGARPCRLPRGARTRTACAGRWRSYFRSSISGAYPGRRTSSRAICCQSSRSCACWRQSPSLPASASSGVSRSHAPFEQH